MLRVQRKQSRFVLLGCKRYYDAAQDTVAGAARRERSKGREQISGCSGTMSTPALTEKQKKKAGACAVHCCCGGVGLRGVASVCLFARVISAAHECMQAVLLRVAMMG